MNRDYTFQLNTIPQHPRVTARCDEHIHDVSGLDEVKVAMRSYCAQLAECALDLALKTGHLVPALDLPLEVNVNLEKGMVKVGNALYITQGEVLRNYESAQTSLV